MLVIRVELWPKGDGRRKKKLGEMRIVNTGTGTHERGNYVAEVDTQRRAVWQVGEVEGFPRLSRHAWYLVAKALTAAGIK